MNAAGSTKQSDAITFIANPIRPDELTVTSSSAHTKMIIIVLSTGPIKKPAITSKMSLGSYSR